MARSITSKDVIDKLAKLFAMKDVAWQIRSDNAPEFIAEAIRRWLEQAHVRPMRGAP